jgi:hypothetical protein
MRENLIESKLLSVGTSTRTKLVIESMSLLNHSHSKLFVQALVIISKLIRGLAVRDLIISEPVENLGKFTREHTLNILNIVDFVGLGVVSTDGNYLPIDLTFVNHGVDAQWLDSVDAAHLAGNAADFDDINGIVITLY